MTKKRSRNDPLLPILLVFVFIFLPMLFMSNEKQIFISSGSSAGERVVHGKPSVFDIESDHAFQTFKKAPFVVQSNYQNEIERPNYLNYSNAVLPVDDPEISSDFGWRVAPCDACSSDHQGVDFVPGEGKPVKAILNGIVSKAGINQGYGYWVKIEHIVPTIGGEIERWETIYAHLQADSIPEDVFIGANVARGQIIGAVGSTGISTGPHLHFELHIDGEVTDPLPIISQSQVIQDLKIDWR